MPRAFSRALPEIAGRLSSARQRPSWLGIAWGARTRILASYIVLLAASAVISTLLIRQVLVVRLDARIQEAEQQEVLELERLLAVGLDPETGRPFLAPEALFDAYLARNEPSREEALLTFVDGKFHRSTMGRFPLARLPAEVLADWAALSSDLPGDGESVTGTYDTDLGNAYFRVRRVQLGDSHGSFVVTNLPTAEREELEDLQRYGAVVTLGVLLTASAIAWVIAGRALAPVRLLTETARSISQSNLTRRIDVSGAGDAAEMARSFNAMLDRLEAVFRSQRAFTQDASHELRDPLTICRGHLELLGTDPDEQRETLRLVLDELDRMGRIVDDLQLLVEVEHPDFLRSERVDVAVFTRELLAKVTALAPRQWQIDENAATAIVADGQRLTEAMMNLAQNAVQHTQPDDVIAIGSALDGGDLRLWVRDTGSGIALSDPNPNLRALHARS